MAKKKPKKVERRPFFDDLSPHTKQAIGAVVFFGLGAFFALALANGAGMVGGWTNSALKFTFGSGAYLAPII